MVELMLRFMYSGWVGTKNYHDLYMVADRYDIKLLRVSISDKFEVLLVPSRNSVLII